MMTRVRYSFDSFPLGIAALIILLLALASGGWLALNSPSKRTAALTMWVFHKPHYDSYVPAIRKFEKMHPGVKVDMQLVALSAITRRLQAAFWSDLDVPDLGQLRGQLFLGASKAYRLRRFNRTNPSIRIVGGNGAKPFHSLYQSRTYFRSAARRSPSRYWGLTRGNRF